MSVCIRETASELLMQCPVALVTRYGMGSVMGAGTLARINPATLELRVGEGKRETGGLYAAQPKRRQGIAQ